MKTQKPTYSPLELLLKDPKLAVEKCIREHREAQHMAGEAKTIPFTPYELIDEISQKIQPISTGCLTASILVLYTIEWAMYLVAKGFKNVSLTTRTYDPGMNTYCAKFGIRYITEEQASNMKFDVVVGNPPYQNAAHVGENQKNSQMPLWGLFVKQALSLLKDDGVIGFVTPISWLHSNSIVYKAMVSKNLKYVDLTSKKYFGGVGTTNCFWIMHNNDKYTSTTFVDERDTIEVQLQAKSFIPGMIPGGFVKALSILTKTLNTQPKLGATISYQHDTSAQKHKLSKIRSSEFCHEIAHTNTENLWSNEPATNATQVKVLISLTGSIAKARIDDRLGTTHIMGFVPVANHNEAAICLSLMHTKLYRFIVHACRYSSSIPAALFKALPGVDLTRTWTDAELYKHFNLTDEEIQLIEDTIK